MALFLAGLRSVDQDLIKAAQIDGAGMARIYRRIVLPAIRPIFIAVLVILLQFAIKTFDLVLALTSGGPGIATTVPAIVRLRPTCSSAARWAQGAAAAIMILLALALVLVPYLLLPALARARRRRPVASAVAACTTATRWPAAARPAHRRKLLVYGLLVLFALYYLVPLAVVFLNSFRDLPEITRSSAARPAAHASTLGYWGQAWDEICIGGICEGIQPVFLELAQDGRAGDHHLDRARRAERLCAVEMALPRLGGAVRHRSRSACSCPGQMVLLPWAITLG